MVFAIADALAFFSSITATLMFLAMLTSCENKPSKGSKGNRAKNGSNLKAAHNSSGERGDSLPRRMSGYYTEEEAGGIGSGWKQGVASYGNPDHRMVVVEVGPWPHAWEGRRDPTGERNGREAA
ncbi:hypothetical protein NL676_033611 [Syzygium grande]|nr:hypothetical protein NL676_033611 [Syzygium grande]